jgi:hypothetical protein
MDGYGGLEVSQQFWLTARIYPVEDSRVLLLNALFLDKTGRLIPSSLRLGPTVDGTAIQAELQCIAGRLLSATITIASGTIFPGRIYADICLKVGQVDTADVVAVLTRGYVYVGHPIYWPGGKDRGPLDGPGFFRSFAGVAPGAGNEYTETLEATKCYRILAVKCLFTASATAATRRVYIDLSTDSGIVHHVLGMTGITASQAVLLHFNHLALVQEELTAAPITQQVPLGLMTPFQFALKGFTLGAVNIQAADAFTAIMLAREEFIDLAGF